MPATYTPIASSVLSSSAASVTFSAIPSTYTDLVVRLIARSDRAANSSNLGVRLNAATTNYADINLFKSQSNTILSNRQVIGDLTYQYLGVIPGSSATASTFGTAEFYLPNYTASQNKPASNFSVFENNSTTVSEINLQANLYSSTAAITSIEISTQTPTANFVSGSSFYLFGIKNS
jgi:hypothetical protein